MDVQVELHRALVLRTCPEGHILNAWKKSIIKALCCMFPKPQHTCFLQRRQRATPSTTLWCLFRGLMSSTPHTTVSSLCIIWSLIIKLTENMKNGCVSPCACFSRWRLQRAARCRRPGHRQHEAQSEGLLSGWSLQAHHYQTHRCQLVSRLSFSDHAVHDVF